MKTNNFYLAVMLMLAAGHASAAEVLDQAYMDGDLTSGIGDVAAQTFTVGITGTLSRVDLRLGVTSNPEGNVFVFIRNAETDFSGPNLGAVTVPRIDLPFPIQPNDYISLDFSQEHIRVNAGEVLAIIVDIGDLPGITWGLGETTLSSEGLPVGGYSGGLARVHNTATSSGWAPIPSVDFHFRTFVQPIPEPSTLILCCVLGVTGVCVRYYVFAERG